MSDSLQPKHKSWTAIASLAAGPVAAAIILITNPLHTDIAITRMTACTVWMILWWLLEAVPISITSLLPLILFPVFQILNAKTTATHYIHSVSFLYLGTAFLAKTIEKTELHKHCIERFFGYLKHNSFLLYIGLVLITAFCSMWLSNTATALIMIPLTLSLFRNDITPQQKAGLALLIAYSANIGGMMSLVGTGPNLVFSHLWSSYFPNEPDIGLFDWFKLSLPIGITILFSMFLYLVWQFKLNTLPNISNTFASPSKSISFSADQKSSAFIFTITLFLWLTRKYFINSGQGWGPWFPDADDATIAMFAAFLCFCWPSFNHTADTSPHSKRLLTLQDIKESPWDILMLIGGGFALGAGFQSTGFDQWVAQQFSQLSFSEPWQLLAGLTSGMSLLTEVTSNVTSTQVLLPIVAQLQNNYDLPPMIAMIGVTMSASFAFMLPIATPPNAIAYGTGHLSIQQMICAGFWLNLLSVLIITIALSMMTT